MRNISKYLIVLTAFIAVSVMLTSCGKEPQKEEEPKIVEQIDTLLNAENINYLKDSINLIEFVTKLKELKATKTDCFGTVEQYSKTADRAKMLIRFGMLYTDILYKRFVNGEIQTTEYDDIAKRYIKDLNLSTILTGKFGEYVAALTAKGTTEEQVKEIKSKLQAEKYKIIETAKATNEDFLVYFTFGACVEFSHIIASQKDSKQFETIIGTLKQIVAKRQFPANKFFNRILNFVSDNPVHKEYKTHISKMKPILDAIHSSFVNNQKMSKEDGEKLIKQIEMLRNEFLN